MTLSLSKAIFPFSPGKVANAEEVVEDSWFGTGGEKNMIMPEENKVTESTPTRKKRYATLLKIVLFSSNNSADSLNVSRIGYKLYQ
jgi:hypothetical protein